MFTIGEFSELTNISTKRLRYYNKINLLVPAYIDQETGYRYFTEEQLYKAAMIKRLRYMDFSIEEIKIFFNKKDIDTLTGLFKQKEIKLKTYIEKALSRLKRIQTRIESLAEAKEIEINRTWEKNIIKIKEIEERYAVFCRNVSTFNIPNLSKRINCIQNLMEEYSLNIIEPPFISFHDGYEKNSIDNRDFELSYFLSTPCIEPKNNVKKIPKGKFAVTICRGSYQNSIKNYLEIIKWTKSNGYKITGPPMRIYLTSIFYAKSIQDIVTELHVPVK